MTRLYEEIVGRGGVSPEYFLDRMDIPECAAYITGIRRKERSELEKIRMVMWASLRPYCKELELDDVMKLDGDTDTTESREEYERELEEVRKRAKMFENG